MAVKTLNVSFGKYTENDTVGVSLTTTPAAAAFTTGDCIQFVGLDLAGKTATSISASHNAAPVVMTDYIVAEDIKVGDVFVVVYPIRDKDYIKVHVAGSNS